MNLTVDLDAEKACLGAAFIDDECRHKVVEMGAEVWSNDLHRDIYNAIRELGKADVLLVGGWLKENGCMADLTTVLTCENAVPSIANLDEYIAKVRDRWMRRQLVNQAERMKLKANGDATPAEQQAAQAAADMMNLNAKVVARNGLHEISSILNDRLDDYEKAATAEGITGIPTGIDGLDMRTGGFQRGEMTILAARPSIGKSALAMQMAEAAAEAGFRVLFGSQEMPKESLADRLIGARADIQPFKLRSGQVYGDAQWKAIADAMNKLAALPIVIDDGQLTTDRIWSMGRRLKVQGGLDLIIVDYLQLLGDKGEGNEQQRVSTMSHRLKAIARDLNVAMLVLSQLNRASVRDDEKPELHHLRDSGAIEQDADVVLLMHTEKADLDKSPRPTTLRIAKQRGGPLGNINLLFFRNRVTFKESSDREEEDYRGSQAQRNHGPKCED